MIALPNGCKVSKMRVFPDNWKSPKANMKVNWYFTYRFYDADKKVKQIHVRGMNRLSTWDARKDATETLLDKELGDLKRGWNPIINNKLIEEVEDYEIDPATPFGHALEAAYKKLTVPKSTLDSIKSFKKISIGILKTFNFYLKPVNEIKRRHVKMWLEKCAKERNLSASNYNHYRAYMQMLFRVLVDVEAIEFNPVDKSLKKQTEIEKIKEVLKETDRKAIDKHLRENHYTFWRYLHIFFHSGARSTELFRLQGKDVDFDNQRFKATVMKGGKPHETWKTIKDIALPLWEELAYDLDPEYFLFGRGLSPSVKPIKAYQITKRWTKLVRKHKDFKHIKVGFYSLKHLNTTEIVTLLSEEDAARLNSHKGTGMVRKIYDIDQAKRQHERLKSVKNKFA